MNRIMYLEQQNKKYPVFISTAESTKFNKNSIVHLFCEFVGIDQDCLVEDLFDFVDIIADLIKERLEREKSFRDDYLKLRFSVKDRQRLEFKAKENGYKNVNSYAKDRLLQLA